MEMENVIEIDVEASEAKQGLSAYEVYLQHGGTMTEEEWLESLQGKTPTIGENENWFIDDVDTGLPSRGEKGDSVVYDLFVVDSTAIQFMLGTYSDNVIGHKFDDDITNIIEEHINDAYERGYNTLVLKASFVRSESDSNSPCYERLYTWSNGSGGNLQNKPKTIYLNAVTDVTQTSIADSTIVVSLTWSGDTATVTDARIHGYRSKFLATNYSSEFTPTKDYHPATKKYVDDSIATVETPDIDLSNYYTKEETDTAIANIDIPTPENEIKTISENVDISTLTTGIYYVNENVMLTGGGTQYVFTNTLPITVTNVTDTLTYVCWNFNNYFHKLDTQGIYEKFSLADMTTGIEHININGSLCANNYILSGANERNAMAAAIKKVTVGGTKTGNIITNYQDEIFLWTVRRTGTQNGYPKFGFSAFGTYGFANKIALIEGRILLNDSDFSFYSASRETLAYSANETNVLTKNNTTEFTPTEDYHPATKKYVEEASAIVAEEVIANRFNAEEITYPVPDSIPEVTYEVSKLGENDYEFVLDETTGFYVSNNKAVDDSYALSKVNIISDKAIRIKVSYINYAYNGYNFGLFSTLDSELTASNTEDTENVLLSLKYDHSKDIKEFYMDVPAGEHFFTAKYIRRTSSSYQNDNLQFKVETVCELETSNIASKKYVNDIIDNMDIPEIDEFDIPIISVGGISIPGWSATTESYSKTTNNGNEIMRMSAVINHIYTKGYTNCKLLLTDRNNYVSCLFYPVKSDVTNGTFAEQKTVYRFAGGTFGKVQGKTTFNLDIHDFIGYTLQVNGTWTDNVFSCSNIYIYRTTPYATEAYVDDAVANMDVPVKYLYEIDYDLGTNTPNTLNPQDKTILKDKLTNIINDVYSKEQAMFSLFLYAKTSNGSETRGGLFTPQIRGDRNLLTKPSYYDLYTHIQNGNSGNTLNGTVKMTQMSIYLSWDENGIATVTDVNFTLRDFTSVSSNNVLTKTNTTSYTPTSDYHPATKKYVDDAIAAAITTVLEGEY